MEEIPVTRLTPSERRTEHPANAMWLAVAVLRLGLRRGPVQIRLIEEKEVVRGN